MAGKARCLGALAFLVASGVLNAGDSVSVLGKDWKIGHAAKDDQQQLTEYVLPGETVEIRNGHVFINGTELQEPYLDIEHNQMLHDNSVTTVKEHYFFVMGDNRDNSSDSRYWGLVPEKYVYGKAFFRYWKPENIGFIVHGESNVPDENPTIKQDDDSER